MQINFNQTEEQVRAEWTGSDRRAPVAQAKQSAPRLVARADRFWLIVLATFAVVAFVAAVVL